MFQSSFANATLPSPLTTRIQQTALQARHLLDQETLLAKRLGDRNLRASFVSKATARAESTISSIVVHLISTHPTLAESIISEAVDTMPEFRIGIMRRAHEAFPRLGVDQPIVQSTKKRPFSPTKTGSVNDPLEELNRAIFAFNDGVDVYVFRPLSAFYGFITPATIKFRVGNFFDNLSLPIVTANQLLQLEISGAAATTGRFTINSTLGVLGLFDIAHDLGIPHQAADFGQTLYTYGAESGPYLVLPLFGPNTVRDSVGVAVDIFLNPRTYLLPTGANTVIATAETVHKREALLIPLEDLRTTSIDYYASIRSLYLQNRQLFLKGNDIADGPDINSLFDAID